MEECKCEVVVGRKVREEHTSKVMDGDWEMAPSRGNFLHKTTCHETWPQRR